MSSFSCPHFDMEREFCRKVGVACVPGRLGCVLRHNSVFAVPVEDRLPPKATTDAPAPPTSTGDAAPPEGGS